MLVFILKLRSLVVKLLLELNTAMVDVVHELITLVHLGITTLLRDALIDVLYSVQFASTNLHTSNILGRDDQSVLRVSSRVLTVFLKQLAVCLALFCEGSTLK
ncbi:hypothetical protein KXD40_004517 [Peronospora effusa]|nr:hypothetical protein KXD40_004517 [Peronospora effusa]